MSDMSDWCNDNGMLDSTLFEPGGLICCRYCGCPDLYWVNTGGRNSPVWSLADSTGKIHACSEWRAWTKGEW